MTEPEVCPACGKKRVDAEMEEQTGYKICWSCFEQCGYGESEISDTN